MAQGCQRKNLSDSDFAHGCEVAVSAPDITCVFKVVLPAAENKLRKVSISCVYFLSQRARPSLETSGVWVNLQSLVFWETRGRKKVLICSSCQSRRLGLPRHIWLQAWRCQLHTWEKTPVARHCNTHVRIHLSHSDSRCKLLKSIANCKL